MSVGSCEVLVVGDETKGFPPFQPLSSIFIRPGFTFQAVMEGKLALNGFEIEPR